MKPRTAARVARELQLTSSARTQSVEFHGKSMWPFLRDGDRVTVEPVSWDDIRRGDIVTYRSEMKFPTRRVVGKDRDRLRLWCENWPFSDFEAHRDDLLGRATSIQRPGVRLIRTDPEWRRATRKALIAHRIHKARETIRRCRRAIQELLPGTAG